MILGAPNTIRRLCCDRERDRHTTFGCYANNGLREDFVERHCPVVRVLGGMNAEESG